MSGPRRVSSVDAANRMTEQWIRGCADESSVFCAPSAWPLIALLADAADGQGRKELEHAAGLSAADCRAAALEILGRQREMTAVRAALGIWAREQYPLDPAWTSGLPSGVIGRLAGERAADRAMLNRWAHERTGGPIDTKPIEVDEETLLVLPPRCRCASAGSSRSPSRDTDSRTAPGTCSVSTSAIDARTAAAGSSGSQPQ